MGSSSDFLSSTLSFQSKTFSQPEPCSLFEPVLVARSQQRRQTYRLQVILKKISLVDKFEIECQFVGIANKSVQAIKMFLEPSHYFGEIVLRINSLHGAGRKRSEGTSGPLGFE